MKFFHRDMHICLAKFHLTTCCWFSWPQVRLAGIEAILLFMRSFDGLNKETT